MRYLPATCGVYAGRLLHRAKPQRIPAEVNATPTATVAIVCKTVGSAYVGSNPTPATSQCTSSARCRVFRRALAVCSQMPLNAAVSRCAWDICGMTGRPAVPLSSAQLERGFDPCVGEVLAVVEAFGIHPEQHLDTMTGALGNLRRWYSGVEPERHGRVAEVVRAAC